MITWGELLYGAEKSQDRKKIILLLDELKAIIPVLPIPEDAGKGYETAASTRFKLN